MSWAWWDWPLTWLTNHRPSVLWHCWLGHVTHKIVSEMTYNTLNSTIPFLMPSQQNQSTEGLSSCKFMNHHIIIIIRRIIMHTVSEYNRIWDTEIIILLFKKYNFNHRWGIHCRCAGHQILFTRFCLLPWSVLWLAVAKCKSCSKFHWDRSRRFLLSL